MKVKELIEILKAVEDTEMEVCFLANHEGLFDVSKVEISTLTEHSGVGIILKDYSS